MHPASFWEFYRPRQVNNIYFDTPSLDAFNNNAAGIAERRKYRLRWYGTELNVLKNPKFEVKIKDRELGYKLNQKINTTNWPDLQEAIQDLPWLKYHPLQPVLVNTYHRKYFLSQDGRFRITLDKNLRFAPFQWSMPVKTTYPSSSPALILEIKYLAEHDQKSKAIFDHIPFRLSKNSKYMEGINMIWQH